MELFIKYFEFKSNPELKELFPDLDFSTQVDSSFYIYTKDDSDVITFLLSTTVSPLSFHGFHSFTIPDDSNTYYFRLRLDYGLVLYALADADDFSTMTPIPYKVNIFANFLSVFDGLGWDGKPLPTLKDTVLDGFSSVDSAIDRLDENFDDVLNSISDKAQDVSLELVSKSDSLTNAIASSVTQIVDKVSSERDVLSSFMTDKTSLILSSISDISLDIDVGSLSNSVSYSVSNALTSKIDSLVDTVAFSSLNGSCGSYPDGTSVSIDGLTGTYVVDSSMMLKNDDNQYIVVYKLSKDGHTGLFPSVMLSLAEG